MFPLRPLSQGAQAACGQSCRFVLLGSLPWIAVILSCVPLMDDGAPYTLCEFSMFLFGGFVCFCFVFFIESFLVQSNFDEIQIIP